MLFRSFLEAGLNERPVHAVYVSSFFMDKYEVSRELWLDVYSWAITNGYSFNNVGTFKAATHPVHTINWYDAVKWCNARAEKEGLTPCYYTTISQTNIYRSGNLELTNDCVKWSANGYRLPTEAEWEKAARGGLNARRFPWGDTIAHSDANYYAQPGSYAYDVSPTSGYHPSYQGGGIPYTSPTGSFATNSYGLYDVSGNVWEWVWDWYDGTYYGQPSATQDNPRGPVSASNYRALRGGDWNNNAIYARCAYRNYSEPVNAYNHLGFRCVKGPSPLIIGQPQNAYGIQGSTVSFSVNIQSSITFTCQWRFNATNGLTGQTNLTLMLTNISLSQAGSYSVMVSNSSGSVVSSNATLTVLVAGADDDSDGLLNETEIQLGTNPLLSDTDGDGLNDYAELFAYGTNPLKTDTDGDGIPDGWEVLYGLNPLVNDANDDADFDGV